MQLLLWGYSPNSPSYLNVFFSYKEYLYIFLQLTVHTIVGKCYHVFRATLFSRSVRTVHTRMCRIVS